MKIMIYYFSSYEDQGMEDDAEWVPTILPISKTGEALYGDLEKYRGIDFIQYWSSDNGVDAMAELIQMVKQYQQTENKEDVFLTTKDSDGEAIAKIYKNKVSVHLPQEDNNYFVGDMSVKAFLTIAQIWYMYLKSGFKERMTFYIEE